MPNVVFFAWQQDTPGEHNRTFIWDALVHATNQRGDSAQPEQSPRPEMDTQGVPGTPNIVQTIFDRIQSCSIFVADVSLVGSTERGKRLPNPNVLIELGFAARSIGWNRTILVLNQALGPADALPFDILQHRWPIQYRLTDSTTVRDRRFETLSEALETALRDCERHALQRAAEMAVALDTACLDFVAENETTQLIEMPLPAKSMGQLLNSLQFNSVVRRLMDLGALEVVARPLIGYAWTHDGRRMIDQVNKMHPQLFMILRLHKQEKSDTP